MSYDFSIFLKDLNIHHSWKEFFKNNKVQMELKIIEEKISGEQFTPSPNVALRFASLDLKQIRIAIIGKDPYPQAGIATGRSFEVNGVRSWFDPAINSSLKNMIKAIHKSHFNYDEGSSIAKVREDINQTVFPILPPNEAFSHWEEQGVLFLNTAFTCRQGGFEEAGSHLSHWKKFFDLLLLHITKHNQDIKYFLWGDARKYAKHLQKHGVNEQLLYQSKHPCTNGDNRGYERNSNFLNNPCFEDTKEEIKWL